MSDYSLKKISLREALDLLTTWMQGRSVYGYSQPKGSLEFLEGLRSQRRFDIFPVYVNKNDHYPIDKTLGISIKVNTDLLEFIAINAIRATLPREINASAPKFIFISGTVNVNEKINEFLQYIDNKMGMSSVPLADETLIEVLVKVGDDTYTFRIPGVDSILVSAIVSGVSQFIRGAFPDAFRHFLQGALIPKDYNNLVSDAQNTYNTVATKLQQFLKLPELEFVSDLVRENIEKFMKTNFDVGSQKFRELVDKLVSEVASATEMEPEEAEKLREDLSSRILDIEGMKRLSRLGYATTLSSALDALLYLIRAGKELSEMAERYEMGRKPGLGTWMYIVDGLTKSAVRGLYDAGRELWKETQGKILDQNGVLPRFLNAVLDFFKDALGKLGRQVPQQGPTYTPPKGPSLKKPASGAKGPGFPSPGFGNLGGGYGRIFYIKQIKTKDPKKVKPITKLPPLSEVVYRILLWWKNLSERDKTVLSSILRRYLTETDDNVRKELERELVSVAKGLGIPVKFKEKKTD